MDSHNLKDFRPDAPNFDETNTQDRPDSEIQVSNYHEEINTLKIEKLSNRVTIISIIIPCLIGAILFYAYLDIKERVVDVDQTKQNQVERISQQLEEKLNALDIKIAKNRFDLDNTLPELDKKNISLEGQITKFADSKADRKTINTQLEKVEKRISDNTALNKTSLLSIEKINKDTTVAVKELQNHFTKNTQTIKNEITLFKEEFDARLLVLSDYEQQIGELRKDLSLLDKKYKRVEQESISQVKLDEKLLELKTESTNQKSNFDKQLDTFNKKFTASIAQLQKEVNLLIKESSTHNSKETVPAITKPKPQINIDSSDPATIQEQPLTE